jgi:hypothetical protein
VQESRNHGTCRGVCPACLFWTGDLRAMEQAELLRNDADYRSDGVACIYVLARAAVLLLPC